MIRELALRLSVWIWFAIAMVFYSSGEYLSKHWGYKPSLLLGVSIPALYSVGTLCWLAIVLHKNEIARMSMIWQIVTTVMSVVVGVVLLREKLTTNQWVGAAIALVGLYFLAKEG